MTDTQDPPDQPAELEPHVAAFLLHRIDEDEKTAQVFIDETTQPAAWFALQELTDPRPASRRHSNMPSAMTQPPSSPSVPRSGGSCCSMRGYDRPVTGRRACPECNGVFPCKTLRLLALTDDDYPGYPRGLGSVTTKRPQPMVGSLFLPAHLRERGAVLRQTRLSSVSNICSYLGL
jgi:hypothetical protein